MTRAQTRRDDNAADAALDRLTGLPSRSYVKRMIDDLWRMESVSDNRGVLLIANIDDFQRINTVCGRRVGDIAQGHDLTAVQGGEGPGFGRIPEGHEFGRIHAPPRGRAYDVQRRLGWYPVGGAGVGPTGSLPHVADIGGGHGVILFRHSQIGHGVLDLTEEQGRTGICRQMDLRFGAGVAKDIHLAEIAGRLGRHRHGQRQGCVFLASGQQKKSHDQAFHGVTLRNAVVASAKATMGHSTMEVSEAQTGIVLAAPATPAAAEVACEAARL